MSSYYKYVLSMVVGALLVLFFQKPLMANLNLKTTKNIISNHFFIAGELSNCEVFFSEDMDKFEQEINAKIDGVKLIESNVILSETTMNLGYYGLICY